VTAPGNLIDLCVNLLGFLGLAMLSYPALHAERYARLMLRLRRLGPINNSPEMIAAHAEARKSLTKHQNSWNRAKSFCLLGGTFATAASYLIAGFKAAGTLLG